MRKLSTIALLMLLAACGQKGPLYLPDSEGSVVTRPTQTETPQPSSQTPSQTPKQQQTTPTDSDENQTKPR